MVKQLNNYYNCHGVFPDCYTGLVDTPEPNGTLPSAPDTGEYHIHEVAIEGGQFRFTLNAPDSLTPDSYMTGVIMKSASQFTLGLPICLTTGR